MAQQPKVYLDDQGNPVGSATGVYVDEAGNPVEQTQQPQPAAIGRPRVAAMLDDMQARSGELRQRAVEHPIATAIEVGLGATPAVVGKLVQAVPRVARASQKFQTVMGAARNAPVDVSNTQPIVNRLLELQSRGNTMRKPVSNYMERITNPAKGPLQYDEARDFIQSINEAIRTTKNAALRREMLRLKHALDNATQAAAATRGHGKTYRSAMTEYAKAKRNQNFAKKASTQIQRWAVPTGLVGYGLNKLSDLVRGE